jgi:hypothetical protein
MKKPIAISLSILFLSLFFGQQLFSQHLTNNGSSITVMDGATLTVTGNITVLSDITINNSGDIFVGGNWTNNAPDPINMKENTGIVTFNGSSLQTIGGISETYYSNLQLDQNTALGSKIKVSALLKLTNARLTLNDYHFVLLPGAQISGAGTDAYIVADGDGILIREVGAIDVDFPVGTNTSYLPVTLNNSGTLDNYGISVFKDVLDGGLTGSTIPEIENCVNNTWNIIEETPGGSDLSVTAQWNATNEGASFDRAQSGIGHFTGGAWNPQDAGPASGNNPYSLTRTGITSLSAFAVGDNNSPMAVTIVYDEQDIFLFDGWAGVSSYLVPVDPAVEEIMAPVINELVIMQNYTGMYWPGQGINSLGDWDSHSGYQVKMSGEITLTITGTPEINTTLNLFEGWNLIPVLASCNVDLEELFAGTSVEVVKQVAGTMVYWPDFGINTLVNLLPGNAYVVLMGDEESIVFPECDKASFRGQGLMVSGKTTHYAMLLNDISEIAGIDEVLPTPNTHTIAIPASAFTGIRIEAGDILGAFDEFGKCYGLALWDEEAMGITLFGDDKTTTSTDGFNEGGQIYFKVFKTITNEEFLLQATWNNNLPEHDGVFVTNGISSITDFKLSPTGIFSSAQSGIQIFPNPATDQITIRYTSGEEAKLKIYNIHGLEVLSSNLNNSPSDVNISMLPPGAYIVKINSKKSSFVQRLIIK